MRTPRIWFVEDIHDQTALWIKAYKSEQPGTVKVTERTDNDEILDAEVLLAEWAKTFAGNNKKVVEGSIVDRTQKWLKRNQ